jgi:hypothetical protein
VPNRDGYDCSLCIRSLPDDPCSWRCIFLVCLSILPDSCFCGVAITFTSLLGTKCPRSPRPRFHKSLKTCSHRVASDVDLQGFEGDQVANEMPITTLVARYDTVYMILTIERDSRYISCYSERLKAAERQINNCQRLQTMSVGLQSFMAFSLRVRYSYED